jgi:hypothetical protein
VVWWLRKLRAGLPLVSAVRVVGSTLDFWGYFFIFLFFTPGDGNYQGMFGP